MAIYLRREFLDGIKQHAEKAFPDECCGFLLGTLADGHKEVSEILPATNEHETLKQRRFLISAEAYMAAEKHAEQEGWEILGFYHSHPDRPACPSAYDLRLAWYWYSYVIISVQQGRATEVTCWVLQESPREFNQEHLQLV